MKTILLTKVFQNNLIESVERFTFCLRLMVKPKNKHEFKKLDVFSAASMKSIALENLIYSVDWANKHGKFYFYPHYTSWNMIKLDVDEIKIPLNVMR